LKPDLSPIIKIANPGALNGKTHTSGKRALKLIRRGHAVLQQDGRLWVDPRYSQLPSFRPEQAKSGFRWYVGKSAGFEVVMAEHGLERS